MGLQYSIDVLAALKDAGYSQGRLKKEKIIMGSSLDKLRHEQPVNWIIIERICELLRCQPSDFLIYEFDD